MILKFRVANFRCITDVVELNLINPTLRTNVPRGDQTWTSVTERVAAIYGANASGKTTLLDAINALAHAIQSPGFDRIYEPSALIDNAEKPCEYEVSFTANGVRYDYEVSAKAWGISWEALYAYPKGTRRVLFERTAEAGSERPTIKSGSSLRGPTAEVARITLHNMLFLATARQYGHEALAPIAKGIASSAGVSHITFRERQDDEVLKRVVAEMIADETLADGIIQALVQAADLGIDSIEIKRSKIPQELYEKITRAIAALNDGDETDIDYPRIHDVVVFHHHDGSGGTFTLSVERQSSGTITWLTTAWHTLEALKNGSTLLIDEIDASLHPDLSRYIVQLFLSPELNPRGAQLIFTTHDVSLLSNAPLRLLEPHNIWFVERAREGHRDLYSLDEFDNRAGNNNARRYLAGQFGALPEINESPLLQYITTGRRKTQDYDDQKPHQTPA